MEIIVKKDATGISVDKITDSAKIGISLGSKKYVVTRSRGNYKLYNRYLVDVFNNTRSRVFSSKRDLVDNILSKNYHHPITVYKFKNEEELLTWFSKNNKTKMATVVSYPSEKALSTDTKEPIKFVYMLSGLNFVETGNTPKGYKNVELLSFDFVIKGKPAESPMGRFDLMLAYDDNRSEARFYLGHFNDGAIEETK